MGGETATGGAPRAGAAIAIGNFDGVHSGHRTLVARAIEAARREAIASMVLTFDRHPATIVRPSSAPRLLTSLDAKLDLLRATGVDDIVVLGFDAERAAESAEDFVATVLVGELAAREVVVGESFRFGHDQGGDVALLAAMGATLGFRVVSVPLVADDHGDEEVVSSTRIRRLVAAGRLEDAAELLGRSHEVRACVLAAGEHRSPVVVRVAPELLLPPAGRYEGELVELASGRGVPAVIEVPGPAGEPAPLLVAEVASPVELACAPTGAADAGALRAGSEVGVRFLCSTAQ